MGLRKSCCTLGAIISLDLLHWIQLRLLVDVSISSLLVNDGVVKYHACHWVMESSCWFEEFLCFWCRWHCFQVVQQEFKCLLEQMVNH